MKTPIVALTLVVLMATGCANSTKQSSVQPQAITTEDISSDRGKIIQSPTTANPADYAKVFRDAHASVERWHVIREFHLASAIESLSSHGADIRPYLIGLTKSERYEQRGWPFWALVCGTLAEVGGEQGAAAMKDLKQDAKAYKHAREYAEKVLAGKWPPDSANNSVEQTR